MSGRCARALRAVWRRNCVRAACGLGRRAQRRAPEASISAIRFAVGEIDAPATTASIRAAACNLARAVAAEQPLLLILEDAQWAEPAMLELAAQVAREPKVRVLACARLDAVDLQPDLLLQVQPLELDRGDEGARADLAGAQDRRSSASPRRRRREPARARAARPPPRRRAVIRTRCPRASTRCCRRGWRAFAGGAWSRRACFGHGARVLGLRCCRARARCRATDGRDRPADRPRVRCRRARRRRARSDLAHALACLLRRAPRLRVHELAASRRALSGDTEAAPRRPPRTARRTARTRRRA